MAVAAGVLEDLHRRERQGMRGSQAVARRLERFDRLGLQIRFGRGGRPLLTLGGLLLCQGRCTLGVRGSSRHHERQQQHQQCLAKKLVSDDHGDPSNNWIEVVVLIPLGNHPAFDHFVDDGSRNYVDECGAHLRIVAQQLHGFLLLLCRRLFLGFLLPQLLAARLLVFLGYPVGDGVQDRVLSVGDAHVKQRDHQCTQVRTLDHGFLLISCSTRTTCPHVDVAKIDRRYFGCRELANLTVGLVHWSYHSYESLSRPEHWPCSHSRAHEPLCLYHHSASIELKSCRSPVELAPAC